MKDYIILIPAYNPSSKLLELINDLRKYNVKILIVNDGSITGKNVFNKIKKINNCVLLEYNDNKGKGYAMKYGMQYYLDNLKNDYKGIITVDADYQHIPSDINKLAINMGVDTIVLGSRNFYLKDIPLTNKIGNRLTSFIFKMLYGIKISDTQTGLRGIPNRFIKEAIEIEGNRFEYEMEFLIHFVNSKVDIEEIDIETIYYHKSESKFNKIIDSMKIYKVMLKESFRFLVTSLISSFLDIILFTVGMNVFANLNDLAIIFSTFFARIAADFLNFKLTKYFVFNSNEDEKNILFKYYILSFAKMFTSALCVLLINKIININTTVIKMVVDILIYFISYRVQKKYIFKTVSDE